MMTFCPEHPKWDHNPKFTPLSETTSIPTPFICRVPPRCYHSSIVLAINSSGWEKTPLLFIKMRIAFHVDHKFTLIFSFFFKWNGLLKMVNFFFFWKRQNLGRSDDARRRKKRGSPNWWKKQNSGNVRREGLRAVFKEAGRKRPSFSPSPASPLPR